MAECLLQCCLEGRPTDPTLEQEPAGLPVSLERERQGAKFLRQSGVVIPLAGLAMDEDRPWSR
jgi:hypothetical protein